MDRMCSRITKIDQFWRSNWVIVHCGGFTSKKRALPPVYFLTIPPLANGARIPRSFFTFFLEKQSNLGKTNSTNNDLKGGFFPPPRWYICATSRLLQSAAVSEWIEIARYFSHSLSVWRYMEWNSSFVFPRGTGNWLSHSILLALTIAHDRYRTLSAISIGYTFPFLTHHQLHPFVLREKNLTEGELENDRRSQQWNFLVPRGKKIIHAWKFDFRGRSGKRDSQSMPKPRCLYICSISGPDKKCTHLCKYMLWIQRFFKETAEQCIPLSFSVM